jgi:hypothetical protein
MEYSNAGQSSIIDWLQGQPADPNCYTSNGAICTRISPDTRVKSVKRVALEEIINGMSQKRRRRSPSKGENPVTPRSGRARQPEQPEEEQLDDDATPRSRNEPLAFHPFAPSSAIDDVSNWKSPTWSTYSSSSRSKSPIKRLGDLQLMDTRVRAVDFGDMRFPLPRDAQDLSDNIQLLAGGEGVIPDMNRVRYPILNTQTCSQFCNLANWNITDTSRAAPRKPQASYLQLWGEYE